MTVYAACAEHLDEAIDEFLRIHLTAPDLTRVGEAGKACGTAPFRCFLCAEPPVYMVTGSRTDAGEGS